MPCIISDWAENYGNWKRIFTMQNQNNISDDTATDLPAYQAPELTVLEAYKTATGPDPDPNEFTPILQMS